MRYGRPVLVLALLPKKSTLDCVGVKNENGTEQNKNTLQYRDPKVEGMTSAKAMLEKRSEKMWRR